MIVAGVVDVSFSDFASKLFLGTVPNYIERKVKRKSIYIFNENELVFVLFNPQGQAYIMQAFSAQFKTDLTLEKLPYLGNILSLPKNWIFRVFELKSTLHVKAANDIGIVVNDDLFNTYALFDFNQMLGEEKLFKNQNLETVGGK